MERIELEKNAEAFAHDVEAIAQEYREEARAIESRFNELMEQARKIEEMARGEYMGATVEHNRKFAERIAKAAEIRKAGAEQPSHIEAAAKTVIAIMGGPHNEALQGMSADEARNARRRLEACKRLEAEEKRA